MIKTPCYFCDRETPGKRHPGCHSTCKDFKNWKAEDDIKKNIAQKNKDDNGLSDYLTYQKEIKKKLLRKVGRR